jgi:hypothetical protein
VKVICLLVIAIAIGPCSVSANNSYRLSFSMLIPSQRISDSKATALSEALVLHVAETTIFAPPGPKPNSS